MIGQSSPAPSADNGHEWAPAAKAAPTTARSRESGQAAVELALVVPIICLLVLALIDFAKALNYWLDANHLANEGVRQAAVMGSSPQPGGVSRTGSSSRQRAANCATAAARSRRRHRFASRS